MAIFSVLFEILDHSVVLVVVVVVAVVVPVLNCRWHATDVMISGAKHLPLDQ